MDRSGGSVVPFHGNGNAITNGNYKGQHPRSQNGDDVMRYGLAATPRIQISWGTGNHIRLSFIVGSSEQKKDAGKVVEITLGPEVQDASEERRIASASLPFFAVLQTQRRQLLGSSPDERGQGGALSSWWEHVLDYSQNLSNVLETGGAPSGVVPPLLDDSMGDSKPTTAARAIWDLLEIFYVDKGAESWLPERLVDWLLTHGPVFTKDSASLKQRLTGLKQNLSLTVFPEEQTDYWEAIASALAVGWFDFVVKLLRLHGSYRHDQIDDRQTENGLVEAVAVLVSKVPRLRPGILYGEPGVAYKSKPEFAKEWEIWRMQVSKLDRSSYWSECHHKRTLHGLKKLLEILQGKVEALVSTTSYWIELLVANYLHVRPFPNPREGLVSLARTCIASKSNSSTPDELQDLILAIMDEHTEVVIAECAKRFEPWMMAHMVELLKAKSSHAENLLQKETAMQGGISLEELYRLTYAQALASHPLTWQLAPVYLAACARQGLGMLESLLLKVPVSTDNRLALKALEVCRLYDLQAVGAILSRKVAVHNWKHGLTGAAIVWLQKARDNTLLSSLSDQLLASVSSGSNWCHAEALEQMQGLVNLLGSEFQAASGGLSFLHKYKNFKSALQDIHEMRSANAEKQKLSVVGRQAASCLTELFKAGNTPKRFWMPLLQDSLELLEWPELVLLNTAETNVLLNCLQELRLAALCGNVDSVEFSGPTINRIRLALATNLSRSFVQG